MAHPLLKHVRSFLYLAPTVRVCSGIPPTTPHEPHLSIHLPVSSRDRRLVLLRLPLVTSVWQALVLARQALALLRQALVSGTSVVEAVPLVSLTLPPTSLPPPSLLNHIIPVSKPVCGGYGCEEAAHHKSGRCLPPHHPLTHLNAHDALPDALAHCTQVSKHQPPLKQTLSCHYLCPHLGHLEVM